MFAVKMTTPTLSLWKKYFLALALVSILLPMLLVRLRLGSCSGPVGENLGLAKMIIDEDINCTGDGSVKVGQNCDCPNAPCSYFNPTKFARYLPLKTLDQCIKPWKATTLDELIDRFRTFLIYTVIVTSPSTDQRPYPLPTKLMFKHVRKTGGNTFIHTFIDLKKIPAYDVETLISWENKNSAQRLREILRVFEKNPRHQNYTVFAMVRDPLERFVSLASEIVKDMATPKICGNMTMTTNQQKIECILKYAENGGENVNLVPMFVDLYHSVQNREIDVALYDKAHVTALTSQLGSNRGDKQFNKSPHSWSIADLNEDMTSRICKLYMLDVLMMREIGYDVNYCNVTPSEQ